MSAFNKFARRKRLGNAQRVDANQDQIVSVLEAVGASVLIIGRPVDLLVGFRGMTFLLEVKNPDSAYGKKGDNKAQAEFAKLWRGHPPATVSTPLEALQAIRATVNGSGSSATGTRPTADAHGSPSASAPSAAASMTASPVPTKPRPVPMVKARKF